jgi:hypothetical protein
MARYELRPVGVFDRELGRAIRNTDPEWRTYEAWLATPGNVVGPAPVEPVPVRTPFDPLAAGRAREARKLEQLAKRNPVEAALVASGLKRRTSR